jgi:hypothetical protein
MSAHDGVEAPGKRSPEITKVPASKTSENDSPQEKILMSQNEDGTNDQSYESA